MDCPRGNPGCDPSSQHPCFGCKAEYWRTEGMPRIQVPAYFKQEFTQREIAKENIDNAKAEGRELERVR